MSKRVEPQDYAWNALYKIRKRPCHEPRAMCSAEPDVRHLIRARCCRVTDHSDFHDAGVPGRGEGEATMG